ncbi:MAG TPA: hypothetical protein VHB47_22415 [Thermoanaerobaculia bacterium]|jgi:hypothetical protein|nr:hypothetical protein [Thermoanaerobaculia bacterium]
MHRRFLAAIDAAVDRALPAGWPRLPHHWLPVRGSVRARHAFRLAHDTGPRPYLAVVALPPFAARTPAVECDLAALVDRVLGRGGTLLLLFEHESDPNGWVREHLDFPHPRFLCLACVAPRSGGSDGGDGSDRGNAAEDYTAAPSYHRREPLSEVIRHLWSGHLSYRGPCEGAQTVGVEIMKSACWRCHISLDVVTGIVFPDREVADWSCTDWTYYQALLQLARIPDPIIPILSAAVEAWRAAGDRRLTVIRWRYSKTVENAYWAAECTACGAFQGDFPLMEERMRWLDDLESRRTGILSYRPLCVDVPRQALQELTWSTEVNPHARFLGWYRPGDPELEGSTAIEGFRALTVLAFSEGGAGVAALPAPTPGITGKAGLRLLAIPPAAAAPSGHGPLQRLGEILVTWLGWVGAARRPPILPGTETSDGPPRPPPTPPTRPPPAASPRSATGR